MLNSFDPDETLSYSASHRDPNYLHITWVVIGGLWVSMLFKPFDKIIGRLSNSVAFQSDQICFPYAVVTRGKRVFALKTEFLYSFEIFAFLYFLNIFSLKTFTVIGD